MPAAVAEAVYSSPDAAYYISGPIIQNIKTKKASTSGVYFIDPTTGKFMIGGFPVNLWQRMDNTVATGKTVAFFGSMRKAVNVAIGRDQRLEVSRSYYKFGTNQVGYRMTYDYSVGVIQPTAMGIALTLTS